MPNSIPEVRYSRTAFHPSFSVKTTANVGELFPVGAPVEVYPGDTFKFDDTAVVRVTSSFIKPIVDNLYMDIRHFFVPYRLCFRDYEYVFGNPNPSQWSVDGEKSFPSFVYPQTPYAHTVADYLGFAPVSGSNVIRRGFSVLPFRAFALIWNNWYRDQNTVEEVHVQTGNWSSSENMNNNDWAPNNYMGKLPKVRKHGDLFVSSLPNPQKGASVPIPLSGMAPVIAGDNHLSNIGSSDMTLAYHSGGGSSGVLATSSVNQPLYIDVGARVSRASTTPSTTPVGSGFLSPANLWSDMSTGVGTDVNTLINAVLMNSILVKDAMYGSRYITEYVPAHFGVAAPDILSSPEYLGGGRFPITVQQVYQTSQATEDSPLGAVGANSQSLGKARFSKSFTEHGYLFTVACIRQVHTYQQGIPRAYMRTRKEDFYDPLLATMSFQPIYRDEIFSTVPTIQGSTDFREDIFSYNMAWDHLRRIPNQITGQLRSGVPNSLDIWHLGDYYETAPTYGADFTNENTANIDRVLTVPSSSLDNFLIDVYFDVTAIRVLPRNSMPSLQPKYY